MGRRWRLGRIGGVSVYADPSLTVITVLLSFNLWATFSDPSRFPGLTQPAAVTLSLFTAALFLLSILVHELAHAAMFKARGIPVQDITLYMFGGATRATKESEGPSDEFLVSAVGPLTTALLGGAFLALHAFGGGLFPGPVTVGVFGPLALANLLMAAFNVLPGFPLDGGRMLLAGVWKATGDRARATRITARVGQAVAVAIIVGGIALGISTGDLAFGLWPAVIGLFLFRAATSTVMEIERAGRFRSASAGQVMSAPPPVIAADMSVGAVVDRYLRGHDGEAFPVMEDGHVTGFASLRTARNAPPDRPIREAMAGAGAVVEAGPGERMDVVSDRLRERHSQTVMVLDGGRLVGVIEREDLALFLRGRGPAGARSAGWNGQVPSPPLQIPPRPDGGDSTKA